MTSKTACIIVNYNDWQRTLSLVKSIDSFSSIDAIIVVDNNSTDDSKLRLQNYASSKFFYIQSNSNNGYGSGNNLGILKAEELNIDYIIIANPDVAFTNETIESMVSFISTHENVAIVGGNEINIGQNAWKDISVFKDVLSTSILINRIFRFRYYHKNIFTNENNIEVDIIPGCFLLIDLNKMIEVGMYDERLFLYEEEKVLYRKMTDKGYKSYVNMMALYAHNHREETFDKLTPLVIGKLRLIDSKRKYLKYYRNIDSRAIFIPINIYFAFTVLEMLVYGAGRKFGKQLRLVISSLLKQSEDHSADE